MTDNLNDRHRDREPLFRLDEMARRFRLPFRFLLGAIHDRRLKGKLTAEGWFVTRAAMLELVKQLPGKRSAA